MTFVFALLFLASCSTTVHYSIGMTESEFIQKNRKVVTLREKTLNSSVYLQGDGTQGSWFYYFTNGILTELNQGVRQSDYIFETRNR